MTGLATVAVPQRYRVRVGALGSVTCIQCVTCGREVIARSASKPRGACRECRHVHPPRPSKMLARQAAHQAELRARREASRQVAKPEPKAPETWGSELGFALERHLTEAEACIERIRRIFERGES